MKGCAAPSMRDWGMRNKSLFRKAAALIALGLAFAVPVSSVFGEETTASSAPAYAPASVIQSNGTEGWPQLTDTASDYFCVMDQDTGALLGEKSMNVETPPASLTKIMTCLVAIENGDLDAPVTMTETGVAYAISGSSNLYTQVGEVFTLRDMLYGMMLKSANDIATEIAVFVGGGSLEHFLDMMNARAAEIGCKHTHFANACGMPHEDHYSCAHDLALISQEALKNPLFREIVHTKEYTIPATNMNEARTFQNHHKFLVTEEYAYDGIIGGKTGYTDLAGSCLATYVERDGRTVIVIALHCLGMDNCLADTRKLCDYGLDLFENSSIPNLSGTILEGGLVTLPEGGSFDECETVSNEETTESGAVLTSTRCTWHGRDVGSVLTETIPVTSEPVREESPAEAAAQSEGKAAPPEAAKESFSANAAGSVKNGEAESAEVSRPSSDFVNIFLIAGAAMLVLIILLVVVNVHLRRERNRRRLRNKPRSDKDK